MKYLKPLKNIPSLIVYIFKSIFSILKSKRFWIALAIIVFLYVYAWFFSNFTVNSPIKTIKFQPIIQSRYNIPPAPKKLNLKAPTNKLAVVKVTPTPEVFDNRVADIIAGIHILESGGGSNPEPTAVHNYCKSIGKHNEVGYLPFKNFCFENEDEEILTLSRWFTKRLSTGRSITDVLCEYNLGKTGLVNCKYSINFISL